MPQVLVEFYSIVTNPRRVTEPRESAEVLEEIDRIRSMAGMTVLPSPADLLDRWLEIVRQHPVPGAQVFDYQLVAAMQGHGIRRIYTFDVTPFQRFADVEAVTP